MSVFDHLNPKQKEAVLCTEGPLLVLAGAGSGKTRVLTHRIAYLIEEKGVAPYEILAITFTNKAADEMKERVLNLVDYGDSVWVATFHSTCVRILRRHIDLLGYGTDFTIYDADDAKTTVRRIVKELELDPKQYKERTLAAFISAMKNAAKTPEDVFRDAEQDFRLKKFAEIYDLYEKRLKSNNALDFDDLLLKTVELFEKEEKVLQSYQRRFRYVLVDEYQDTNEVQFRFLYLLTKTHRNLMVVGDDDQSIYRFRGADIRNILEFEEHFPGATVVKLEQNYRSTTSILDVANAVIRRNKGRKEKQLWSDLGAGVPVSFKLYDGAPEEAESVIRDIRNKVRNGASYSDFAVLYRTNNQSRLFEEKCVNFGLPYTIVGGVNFYERAEIKDILAYLKTVNGGRDSLSTERILNVPRRGIGDSTTDKLKDFAFSEGISLLDAIRRADEVPGVERARVKLHEFAALIDGLSAFASDATPEELIREIIDRTDYESTLDAFDEDRAEDKLANLEELCSKANDFYDNWEGEDEPTLTNFLEDVALVADIDSVEEGDDRILLMTLHGSKGLEFPTVYLTGMEEGVFPSYMAITDEDPVALEEERRLCYVGMTRAKRHLYLSAAKWRTVNGSVTYNDVSRFLKEIPRELLEMNDAAKMRLGGDVRRPGYGGYGGGYKPASSYGGGTSNSAYGSSGSGSASGYSGARPAAGTPSAPKTPPSFGLEFKPVKASSLPYTVGDRVRHSRFGEGTVTEITDGARDFEVAVRFDTVGEKRMFASFAKLEKI